MSNPDLNGSRPGLLPRFTLKDGDTFLLADALGDLHDRADGFFSNDTRMLSQFELLIADRSASSLGAAVSQDNTTFIAHLTNRPLPALGERALPEGVIHIERRRLLWKGRLYERLTLSNYGEHKADVPICFSYAADYADIFEVQGYIRRGRGRLLPAKLSERSVCLAYQGLDDVVRKTEIKFSYRPVALSEQNARFLIELERGARESFYIEIDASEESIVQQGGRFEARYDEAVRASQDEAKQLAGDGGSLQTSARLFNQWLDKSRSDLTLLTTRLTTGLYPYAGIPWFSTQFGRDAIITALQTLWLDPRLAAGVLRFLAYTQATESSTFRDAEPGKIMHETRRGEMAKLGEVPFGCYYGGVDTTPLFVMLAGAYEERTGDRTLVDEIWPNLLAAVGWVETRLSRSISGFLDYHRGEGTGLANQAWKDSQDSIFHADGHLAAGPVAVVEVQGYACAALKAMGRLSAGREAPEKGDRWLSRAERLRAAVEERFWLPEMNFYAIAIDGENERCRVRGSNAGHLLFCAVPTAERAAAVRAQLLAQDFCSGWGIRTLPEGAPRYNPMSYHNGSVWPHDTAICAAGIAKYGGRGDVVRLIGNMFEAANAFSMRLPELYCGFARYAGLGPVPYPVACLPQAWASGCAFMLLQAALGIRIDGVTREVHIERPQLPDGVEWLRVRELPVGDSHIDIEFHRLGHQVGAVPFGHLESGIKVLAHL